MANPQNIIGKGNRFSKDNQPANRGRKPKLYTIAKNTYNVSYEEWKGVVLYLLQCTKDEVTKIANKDDTPIWVVNVCNALYKDTKKGSLSALKELTEKIWGKPLQEIRSDVNLQGEVSKYNLAVIPQEDIIALANKMQDARYEQETK